MLTKLRGNDPSNVFWGSLKLKRPHTALFLLQCFGFLVYPGITSCPIQGQQGIAAAAMGLQSENHQRALRTGAGWEVGRVLHIQALLFL